MKIIKELKINKDVFLKAYDLCKFKEKPIKLVYFNNTTKFRAYFKSFYVDIKAYRIDLYKIDKKYINWHCKDMLVAYEKTIINIIHKKLNNIFCKTFEIKWEDVLYFNIIVYKNY